jgi:ferredoxin--NADP+ reductase
VPLAGIPFDARRGVIRNEGGRVVDDDGNPSPGEYVTGWIKRGPSGVIGTNKKDSQDTVAKVIEDAQGGRLPEPRHEDVDALIARAPHAVDWQGWEAIDRLEREAGEPQGRPRVKLVDWDELRKAARRGAPASSRG